MRNSISHVTFYQEDIFQEDKKMSRLPKEIRNNLREEASVSLRLDPFDVSMVNALPIRKVFHTRNSWTSGYTKGSTEKRKLLPRESPKTLA